MVAYTQASLSCTVCVCVCVREREGGGGGGGGEGVTTQNMTVHLVKSHLDGPVVKLSALRAEGLGFNFCLCHRDFSGSSHTSDLKIGSIGSPLGLVGLASVYCDLMR